MENKMMSLSDVLSELKKQRNIFLGESVKSCQKMLPKLEELIAKTEMLKNNSDLSNTIVVGSLVDLRIKYNDDEVEDISYFLGMDFSGDTVSIYSPLGSSIYGALVNDTVSYKVKDEIIEVTILSKDKTVDDTKKLLLENN